METLIPPPPAPEITPAKQVADAIIAESNRQFPQRLAVFKSLWEQLWENPSATPAQVLAEWGTNAKLMFQVAAAERQWIITVATALGKTPAEVLGDSKYLSTALPINPPHEDGTVTLQ
jgi:hypothetical protein